MKQIDVIAAVLVVVGALNWGLIAVARFDLVATLFGMQFGEVSPASASSTGWSVLRAVPGRVVEARAEPLGAARGDLDSVVRQLTTRSRGTNK